MKEYILGFTLVFLGFCLGCLFGSLSGYEYAKRQIIPSTIVQSSETKYRSFPIIKMSEFQETDSVQGGYFIGILKIKNGGFKHVKYPVSLFVTKENDVILQEVVLQLNDRVKKLETQLK